MDTYKNSQGFTLQGFAIKLGAAAVLLLLFAMFVLAFKVIDGHERGVFVGIRGVSDQPAQPGLHWYCPMTTSLKIANVGQQRFVMDNTPSSTEKHANGRETDELLLKSRDNQNVYVSCALLWRRDPSKVVEQQRTICSVDDEEAFTELVIRQPLMTVVKNNVTILDAIDSYSGEKHVALQKTILETLRSANFDYAKRGVIVDDFVMEVRFDKQFIEPIVQRQIAVQQQSTLVQQQIAAEKEALVAKAKAQTDLNKNVVAAESAKQVAILKAEQEQQKVILEAEAANKQVVLAAEAAKQQVVLAAEAEKAAGQNRADAILAIGKANAEAEKLKYAAYSAPGADVYAKIQIAENLAKAYSGVKGFVPEKMSINTFADSFQGAVKSFSIPVPQQEAQPAAGR